jgi:hypothetical protein
MSCCGKLRIAHDVRKVCARDRVALEPGETRDREIDNADLVTAIVGDAACDHVHAEPAWRVTPSTAFPVITAEFKLTVLCNTVRIPLPELFLMIGCEIRSPGAATKIPPFPINTPSDPFPLICPPNRCTDPAPIDRPTSALFWIMQSKNHVGITSPVNRGSGISL